MTLPVRLQNILATILGGLGGLILLAGVVGLHDYGKPEDSRILWVCNIHGNGLCGPDTMPILVDPKQILSW